MARRDSTQLNIRSRIARQRATELARITGRSLTQIVEEAVTAYRPEPPAQEALPKGLIRKGKFLVFSPADAPQTSLEATLAAIDDSRNRDAWVPCED